VLAPVLVAEVYALLPAALWVVVRPRFREAAGISRCSAADVALAFGACAAAYAATWALTAAIAPRSWAAALSVLQAMGSDDGRLAGAGPALRGVILVRACLLAAVGEEMLFRGVLHTWLRQRVPAGATIALTAAAFAAIHGFPAVLPLAFAIGVGFGWVRERTRSIVPTVVAHALHNLILVSASYALTGWTARLPAWGAP
jgi:membrane protease YdiL (CAAX protease family)